MSRAKSEWQSCLDSLFRAQRDLVTKWLNCRHMYGAATCVATSRVLTTLCSCMYYTTYCLISVRAPPLPQLKAFLILQLNHEFFMCLFNNLDGFFAISLEWNVYIHKKARGVFMKTNRLFTTSSFAARCSPLFELGASPLRRQSHVVKLCRICLGFTPFCHVKPLARRRIRSICFRVGVITSHATDARGAWLVASQPVTNLSAPGWGFGFKS